MKKAILMVRQQGVSPADIEKMPQFFAYFSVKNKTWRSFRRHLYQSYINAESPFFIPIGHFISHEAYPKAVTQASTSHTYRSKASTVEQKRLEALCDLCVSTAMRSSFLS